VEESLRWGFLKTRCEAWFHGLNGKSSTVRFHIGRGHKKVYPGWKLSGVAEGDSEAITKLWSCVDTMIEEVPHSERKDFFPALLATPRQTRLAESTINVLRGSEIDLYDPPKPSVLTLFIELNHLHSLKGLMPKRRKSWQQKSGSHLGAEESQGGGKGDRYAKR
jgi:hypothetical protein